MLEFDLLLLLLLLFRFSSDRTEFLIEQDVLWWLAYCMLSHLTFDAGGEKIIIVKQQ